MSRDDPFQPGDVGVVYGPLLGPSLPHLGGVVAFRLADVLHPGAGGLIAVEHGFKIALEPLGAGTGKEED